MYKFAIGKPEVNRQRLAGQRYAIQPVEGVRGLRFERWRWSQIIPDRVRFRPTAP